jgi:hypothetical protein
MKSKKIKYLNKEFENFKTDLINFAKTYFPNTYNDFGPESPGMMFIEMAAYVGDVLSYYTDYQMKEQMLTQADERENVMILAQSFGYIPSLTSPSSATLDVYMVIPAINDGDGIRVPDWRYALTIKSGLEVASTGNNSVNFRSDQPIIFNNFDNSITPTVYEVDGDSKPTYFLLKKQVQIYSGEVATETYPTPTKPEKYWKMKLSRDDIISIKSVTDSEGYKWYEVPFLAQDTVFIDEPNIYWDDYKQYSGSVPYLIKLKKVSNRFIRRITKNGQMELQFGSGISDNPDEIIVPNPTDYNSVSVNDITGIDNALDPSNFMYTKTYGQVPYDTTLTVKYTYGGGIESNVAQGEITDITNITFEETSAGLEDSVVNSVKSSVAIVNSTSATGGGSAETTDEIRENALASFATQYRAVTQEDYITRAMSLPPKYGTIAKVYISQDAQFNWKHKEIVNPLSLNLYTLGYDANKHYTQLNSAVKRNLKKYIDRYRILTDAINILDAFIINIGVKFEIIAFPQYNKNEVLLSCINAITDFFDVSKWQINQPIVMSDIMNELLLIEGVRNVSNIEIFNRYLESEGYSGNYYSIRVATKDGIVFPSLDPSCFELKYPSKDILGKAR